MQVRLATHIAVLLLLVAVPGAAQSFNEHIAVGDSLQKSMQPAQALEHFRAALEQEPEDYVALWKFALAQIDVAKQLKDEAMSDSLYAVAGEFAERAVRADSADAEGHFVLAYALGQVSRTKGGKERVRYAKEIYDAAARALELNPDHAGAHHILGAWHAEIKRLSGVTRFFARTFLGGGFMGIASWDSSLVHLAVAVGMEPEHVFHRLELAEVLIDVGHFERARVQLNALLELPIADVSDPEHKEEATALLEHIREKP